MPCSVIYLDSDQYVTQFYGIYCKIITFEPFDRFHDFFFFAKRFFFLYNPLEEKKNQESAPKIGSVHRYTHTRLDTAIIIQRTNYMISRETVIQGADSVKSVTPPSGWSGHRNQTTFFF